MDSPSYQYGYQYPFFSNNNNFYYPYSQFPSGQASGGYYGLSTTYGLPLIFSVSFGVISDDQATNVSFVSLSIGAQGGLSADFFPVSNYGDTPVFHFHRLPVMIAA